MQAIVSMPLALSPSAFCAKPGRCLAEQVGLGQLNVVRIGCDFVNDNGSFTLISGIFNMNPVLTSIADAPTRGAITLSFAAPPMRCPAAYGSMLSTRRCWPKPGKLTKTSCPAFSRFLVSRSEEHTSELQSLMRISYAVFCLTKK